LYALNFLILSMAWSVKRCPYFVQLLSSDLYGAAPVHTASTIFHYFNLIDKAWFFPFFSTVVEEINKEEMNAQAPNVTMPT
jgi:hypothetical protein